MDYEFLCIGGNCAGIHTLGEYRVKGPVDNMKSKNGLSSIRAIFENGGLNEEFFTIGEIEQPFCGNHRDENEIWFSTRNYYIIHNNFRDLSFKHSLKQRIDILYKFIKHVNDNNKYLIYSLCEKDIDPISNTMSNLFKQGIKILEKRDILEKVFFLMVISKDRKWYNHCCNDIFKYSKNVIDLNIRIDSVEGNYIKFLNRFNQIKNM